MKSWGIDTYSADIAGQWLGQVDNGKEQRPTVLEHMTAKAVPISGNISLSGSVDIATAGGAVTSRPQQTELKSSNPSLPYYPVGGGTIIADDNGIQAQSMQVTTLGGARGTGCHPNDGRRSGALERIDIAKRHYAIANP